MTLGSLVVHKAICGQLKAAKSTDGSQTSYLQETNLQNDLIRWIKGSVIR